MERPLLRQRAGVRSSVLNGFETDDETGPRAMMDRLHQRESSAADRRAFSKVFSGLVLRFGRGDRTAQSNQRNGPAASEQHAAPVSTDRQGPPRGWLFSQLPPPAPGQGRAGGLNSGSPSPAPLMVIVLRVGLVLRRACGSVAIPWAGP